MFLTKMFEFCIPRVKNAVMAICREEGAMNQKTKENAGKRRRVEGSGGVDLHAHYASGF